MKTAPGTTLITKGPLFDGTGSAPIPDAMVVIQDGRIAYAGPLARAPAVPPSNR
jgi:N-acyl-D-aspartate/D-glutamate deacylase